MTLHKYTFPPVGVIMARKLKATELFLSLGLVASLATACGGPAAEDGVVEPEGDAMEAPVEEAPAGEAPTEEAGGEGGEGGEGG
jgi:hypothetical protein